MSGKKRQEDALQRAIEHFGGVKDLAEALGISRHAVYMWRRVPKLRAYQIEAVTGGKLKAADLNPEARS